MTDPHSLRNRRGEPVDPVPFFVTTGLGFVFAFSFGPMCGLAYGLSLSEALAASAGAFVGATLVAHRRLVDRAPPADAGALPPGPRFERLLYAALALGVLLVGLTIPLL
ncbi:MULTISPECIES: hypothetical protein [Halorubrum]|uniref:Uncharacterized protein n=1 Tax=Halorubrum hochstenium ATCC 700873 TaxID=1227481 RepID=M0F5A3_9EURY|nr:MULTISPECIES: hypothetical protein [Halorubrum]ELZ54422.1 hypothetical protein C467_11749 [Halorubrum hochstenium ATCC 700873]